MTSWADTLRSDLSDLSSENRRPPSLGSCSIHVYTDTKWPVQFPWHVVTQRPESFCSCGVGWQQKCTWPHAHPPENYVMENKHCCLTNISRLINLDRTPRWFRPLSRCTSLPSVSSIHLVMVKPKEDHVPPSELECLLKVHNKRP